MTMMTTCRVAAVGGNVIEMDLESAIGSDGGGHLCMFQWSLFVIISFGFVSFLRRLLFCVVFEKTQGAIGDHSV